jgi:hypothetical protein
MLMARRLGALLAIAIVLSLVAVLIWAVYEHHQAGREMEEPAIVAMDARAA